MRLPWFWWQFVPGRTNFVMEIQLGLWEGLFCMWFGQWWYCFGCLFLQTFAQTFVGLRWWWLVTSFYLHAASGQSLPGFPFCRCWKQLVVEGVWLGMTKMRVVVTPPRKQQTKAGLDAFSPFNSEKTRKSVLTANQWKNQAKVPRNPKQRFSQVDSTNVPNPQHMETHCRTQNFQKFLCLPPKTFNFLSKPPKKTVDFLRSLK